MANAQTLREQSQQIGSMDKRMEKVEKELKEKLQEQTVVNQDISVKMKQLQDFNSALMKDRGDIHIAISNGGAPDSAVEEVSLSPLDDHFLLALPSHPSEMLATLTDDVFSVAGAGSNSEVKELSFGSLIPLGEMPMPVSTEVSASFIGSSLCLVFPTMVTIGACIFPPKPKTVTLETIWDLMAQFGTAFSQCSLKVDFIPMKLESLSADHNKYHQDTAGKITALQDEFKAVKAVQASLIQEQGRLQENKFASSTINDQRALTILQDEHGIEKEESFTKETLGSYNAKLISSIVISQMIDENKSEENGPILLMQPVITQPNAYCIKQSWANHNLVNSNKAFTLIPSKLRTETSLNENASRAILHHRKEKQYHKWRKGFTSITITARQIRPSPNHMLWVASGDPPSLKFNSEDHLMNSNMSSNNARLIQHPTVLHLYGACENRATVNELCSNLSSMQQNSVCNSGYLPSANHQKNVQASFSSCIYLKLDCQYTSTICYIDKSLSVSIDQPQVPAPKMQRSVLLFNINCSSSKSTADGVNGLVNKEPIAELRKRASPKEESLLTANNAEYMECNYVKKQSTLRREQGMGTERPSDCVSPVDFTLIIDHPKDIHHLMVKDRKDVDNSDLYSCIQHRHFLNDGPVKAGESNWCDSFGETKECKEEDKEETACTVPGCSLHVIPEEKETFTQSEGSWKSEHIPPRSLTLREALELFRPAFISQSQKRMQKLELMTQLRKAQANENPLLSHKKQRNLPFAKPLSTPSKKKLYTVPHPLSDNLFKPKERIISEKEMLLRSKRIYNNLPEVKRKKEEEKKRVLFQSNRQRVELFKKKLLDQILQRNAD
ncbi:(E2-independent) E3 ubiquitin-conjugating enzyme FATS [Rhinatrema bivittatum]|uniref:(E2-independent) E3 ubiquitin-conjugating enzyme FATS n=1 Tax=Rhinatrema bivittatum TaxID=194408 RepID=UPI00112E3813|nr:(E2-independent) E3 ubiquitin-conjugating enzyme FATS [Rhinatrema bivittatum]